ncbi:hypothetical protein A2U01_0089388 [Trifolium medium]|uniref:Uncharacterized protein n=1 Tax=Trifolium medium TaxID=97028 RepID=A0A392U3W4_9FABA|nr:hypothetical protein [Trifolium medium]
MIGHLARGETRHHLDTPRDMVTGYQDILRGGDHLLETATVRQLTRNDTVVLCRKESWISHCP